MKAIELFAGVGGFRLGLEAAGHEIVWSNQWEPGKRTQHASDCYVRHFGPENHVNGDIGLVDTNTIPRHDLLVGGFPCQDYSVAKTLSHATGLQGKKGVLWWQIERLARTKKPKYLLLENVDRLLKSPAPQRGRDCGIMLRSLADLGYVVEWRVINAADYGFPQKRRRVFFFAAKKSTPWGRHIAAKAKASNYLHKVGFFAQEFPVRPPAVTLLAERTADLVLPSDLVAMSGSFAYEFQNAGVMVDGQVWTARIEPRTSPLTTLASVLEPSPDPKHLVRGETLERWKYLKGSKREKRVTKQGFAYEYVEGGIPFPDRIDTPARTMLTSEGGTTPSRTNHIIKDPRSGEYRVLTPLECERLNGFPDNWTEEMPDRWRYFTMGNALVVGLIERMGTRLNAKPAMAALGKPKRQARSKPVLQTIV